MDENKRMNNSDNDEIVIDLGAICKDIWEILRKEKAVVIGITAAAVLCTAGYFLAQKREYSSMSLMRIPTSAWEIFRSHDVIDSAFQKHDPEYNEEVGNLDIYEKFVEKHVSIEDALKKEKDKKKKIKKDDDKPGNLMELVVKHTSPQTAKAINQEILERGRKRFEELVIRKLDVQIVYAEQVLQRADKRVEEAAKVVNMAGVGAKNTLSETMGYSASLNVLSSAVANQTKAVENLEKLRQNRKTLELSFEVINSPTEDVKPLPRGLAKKCAIALILGAIVGALVAVVKGKMGSCRA